VTPDQVWAVIPARTGPSAKQRLAGVLTAPERAALALRMMEAVLRTCSSAGLAGTIVVTDSERGFVKARAAGAVVLPDPAAGLNAAVALGLDAVSQQAPGTAALVLPGDVPLVEPEDLRTIISAAGDLPRVVVVVPDAAGRGTNALLIRPPQLIAPSFGEPSCQRHLAAARRRGEAIRLELPRLAVDIDDADRLRLWEGAPSPLR
jgi:2-phospho-L-lactate/phosphoenolpyruvate guanylyltransferase